MMRSAAATCVRYGIALAMLVAAMGVRAAADPLLGNRNPFLPMYAAVFVAARWLSIGETVFVFVVGTVACDYYFFYPRGVILDLSDAPRVANALLFTLIGAAIAALTWADRRSRERTRAEIARRTDAEDRLRARERHLTQLVDVQEAEKRFLCHEFHDGLVQNAVAATMVLETWQHRHGSDPVVDDALGMLRDGLADARRVIRGTRSVVLDDMGLSAAVEELVAGLVRVGMQVDVRHAGGLSGMTAEVEATAYRIVQEALSNARRHAGTEAATVTLAGSPAGLVVEIVDEGRGFDVDAVRGFGLLGMRERARLAGGEVRITSVAGRGTRVWAWLPTRPVTSGQPNGDAMTSAASG